MANVKKFFSNNCNENNYDVSSSCLNYDQYDCDENIEIKLIKQKSQGLISSYYYNSYRGLWNIKGVNGIECECQLNQNAECYGDVRFSYKGQTIRKYFSENENLANACGEVFEILNDMYKEYLTDEELKKKQENELLDNNDMFEMSMDMLAVA